MSFMHSCHLSTRHAYAQVIWKDSLTGIWHGPNPVFIWGQGHVCVFPQNAEGARWLPEQLVSRADVGTYSDVDCDLAEWSDNGGGKLYWTYVPDLLLLHPSV